MIKHLQEYDFPEDLQGIPVEELPILASEIRDFLIHHLQNTGGHLASNLGVVELTLALHKVFDLPKDKIIWDVGHQCYVHKILTGRREGFASLRQFNGMSGFPKRCESPYDSYDTGHSSTSISAAAGMAVARDWQGEESEIISVIGDGAMTGGLAFEGLNHLGGMGKKAIIVLNDNGMSISKNIGGMSNYLGKIRVSQGYARFKARIKSTLDKIPAIGTRMNQGMVHIRDTLKYAIVDGIIFEELGFTYLGPIDGHDIKAVMEQLEIAKEKNGPVLLHVITQKGKGYEAAEEAPDQYHGVKANFHPPKSVEEKEAPALGKEKEPKTLTYSDHFGKAMIQAAEKDSRLVAISAAMIDGTGLKEFSQRYPQRIFDVGIAEAHSITLAAGMAINGLKPVVALYSTFLQRGFDQVIEDVCLQNLPVVFAIDRGGIVGEDGETHHGIFDLSLLKTIPNLTIFAPADGGELEWMLEKALSLHRPVVLRYPRGTAPVCASCEEENREGAQVVAQGSDVEIWAFGGLLSRGMEVAEDLRNKGYSVGLVNPRWIKPLDQRALIDSANRCKLIVTLEDHFLQGGIGETVRNELFSHGVGVHCFGWPDRFIPHGNPEELYEGFGMSREKMVERIGEILERTIR